MHEGESGQYLVLSQTVPARGIIRAMTETTYTIGALARSAGVPVSTVRFYERRGILRPDGRSQANYRRYSETSLQRLRLIRCAQRIGLSLRDARDVLRLIDTERAPCADVEEVMRRRLADVRARIKDLRRVERALLGSLTHCRRGTGGAECAAIIHIKRGGDMPPVEFCTRRA